MIGKILEVDFTEHLHLPIAHITYRDASSTCVVVYEKVVSALQAVSYLNNHMVRGSQITVQLDNRIQERPKEELPRERPPESRPFSIVIESPNPAMTLESILVWHVFFLHD